MCRDVRLHSNPDLSIVQKNTADNERPSSGVCEAVDTSQVTVTYTFLTVDEGDGSMSTKRRRFDIDVECIVSCTSSSSSSLQTYHSPGAL